MIRRAWELLWQLPRGVAGGIRARLQSLYLAPAATSLPVCADLLGVCNHGVSKRTGFFAGLGLTVYRILPLQSLLQGGGYDPVPCSEHEEPPDG